MARRKKAGNPNAKCSYKNEKKFSKASRSKKSYKE